MERLEWSSCAPRLLALAERIELPMAGLAPVRAAPARQ